MKNLVCAIIVFISCISCKTQTASSRSSTPFKAYQVSYDEKNRKVLRGLINRADIENDTAFSWFKQNYNLGKPDAGAVAAFKQHGNNFHILIFGGTWCPD